MALPPSTRRPADPIAPPPSTRRPGELMAPPPSTQRPTDGLAPPPSSPRRSADPPSAGARRGPADLAEPLLALLTRYVSLPTAQSVLTLARRRAGMAFGGIDRAQLGELLGPLDRGLRLFLVDPKQAAECRRGLETLAGGPGGAAPAAPAEGLILEVSVEDDVARVRREARDFAATQGFSMVGQTRLTTAVSELARNIVQYAGAGQLEIRVTSPPGLEIVARDRGPGIANLDQIMAGNYRSRLGMGLGLRGVKKLADRFDVQTGPGRGTIVTFAMKVV